MDPLIDTKLISLLRVLSNVMKLIMMIHSAMWLNLLLFIWFYLLLSLRDGVFASWTYKTCFFMVFLRKMSICDNLLGLKIKIILIINVSWIKPCMA
jgi:hypothetical protein